MDALVRGLRFKVERGVIPYRDALDLLITAAGLTFAEAVQALEDSPCITITGSPN